MSNGIEKVKDRLLRATRALEKAKIPYCVIGGNAVAAWVSTIDESVVRNTRDVDLLVNREDFDRIRDTLHSAGFLHRSVAQLGGGGTMEVFLDGPDAKVRDAIHLVFANERVFADALEPAPSISTAGDEVADFSLIALRDLLILKLTAFRDKDRVHLRDMIEIGQIDESWLHQLPDSLRPRLEELLENPHG